MSSQKPHVLVRYPNGQPALWLDIVDTELLHEDGRRTHNYAGTTLNDTNTSIPFDPANEDLEVTAEDWKRSVQWGG